MRRQPLLGRPAAKVLVFVLCLLPLAWIIWQGATGMLGVNPIEEAVRQSGLWALRILLVALAVTPLRRLTGIAALARFRRMIGLFAAFYAVLHLSAYIGLDQFFDWAAIWKDIVKRPYITVGMGAFLVLVALSATSTDGMIRRLGGKRWRALHKLVFAAGVGGCLHYFMLVKGWQPAPMIYGAILAVLLLLRLPPLQGLRLWRAQHYIGGLRS